MMRPFLPEQIIQKTIEEYIVLMADRIEECEAKLLSLEGTTTPAAEAGAAPMVTEPEPTVSSGGDPAAYPLGDELGDTSQNIMAGSRYFLEVHQQMIKSIMAGAGVTRSGGADPPGPPSAIAGGHRSRFAGRRGL